MTPRNWDRVKQVFQEALEWPAQERLARARELCGDDPILLAEVESLLTTHQRAGSFAERPAVELLNALSIDPAVPGEETVTPLLMVGARLGVYEIRSLIGAGGMGEVYEARDTRLDRAVAIKVLRTRRGDDPRARDRFEREARTVAALSHPHICTLHDVGHHDGVDFLVMERLVGETLEARLARGPLRVAQALDLAIQIASALDVAHRAGIIHRDLKPGNIFLVPSGSAITAKLVDFGLAKAREPAIADLAVRRDSGTPLTTEGAIVGTVRYMAPEQLEGKAADARTDIFALGAVCYEMIAGRRAFDGASEAQVIAATLEHDAPALSQVQPAIPPFLERIVKTCLAKDPNERWQTARDLLHALTWTREGDAVNQPVPATKASTRWRRAVPWAAVVLSGLAIIVAGFYDFQRAPVTTAPSITFSIPPPAGASFQPGAAQMAISPDGSRLAFVASTTGKNQIWVRRFDAVRARALPGTEGGTMPFWSPDGKSIAFFAGGTLKRIAEAGGAPQILCDTSPFGGAGGAWSRDGIIIFSAFDGPIRRVADQGGEATPVTSIDTARDERNHAWPVFLPDGRRFLYLARSNNRQLTGIYQGSIDSSPARHVAAAESRPVLLGAYLLVLSNGSLIARVYDADQATVVGEPIVVADRVESDSPLRSGGAFAAAGGVLAYRSASPASRLVWFDRAGKQLEAVGPPADYQYPRLSSDDNRIALEKTDPATGRHTIWTLDLTRGLTSRLVSDPAGAHVPVWSPDRRHVVFTSNRLGGNDLYSISTDGTGSDQLAVRSNEKSSLAATDWSPDGRILLYENRRPGQIDLWITPTSFTTAGQPFFETPATETHGRFSPDMHWVAYTSNESSVNEVYVRRFPSADGKWQVSTQGGTDPHWRHDGKELFYRARDGALMSADVRAIESRFETGAPRTLFNPGITARGVYEVARDAQRFLLIIGDEAEDSAPITVILNWRATRKK